MRITAAFDPVTRIEGHLKVEITIDTIGGARQVVEASASGGLFRGFERILIGRDPRDAQHITERICGVCPVAHGMAAVRNLDNAFGVQAPDNGRILRNLVAGANFLDSHILHFYLLALPDYIEGPAMPPWQADWDIDRRYCADETAILIDHYRQAVVMRRKAHEMGAVFGGRLPHPPAFIPGGFTANVRPERVTAFRGLLDEIIAFTENVYLPDAAALAARYSDYYAIGRGSANLLAFGAFDLDSAGGAKLFPAGFVPDGAAAVQTFDPALITEQVSHSWYANRTSGLHPSEGETVAENPKDGAYSWLKAPRYQNLPSEVGPLARMRVGNYYAGGVSTMDRHVARAQEALLVARSMREWVDQLDPEGSVYEEPTLPETAAGVGLSEASRGALGHWIHIEGGRIAHYEVISPTTWNASPRDDAGIPGPLEQALLGTPIDDPSMPIEVMRVIHSMDPCLDCSTHVLQPSGEVRVIHAGAI